MYIKINKASREGTKLFPLQAPVLNRSAATAIEALQEESTMNQIVKRLWERWLDGVRQVTGT